MGSNELGTATYHEALEVVDSFSESGGAPSPQEIQGWVIRYFDYLDRNGAFVIRSAEDAPTDRKFRNAVARSHRRTAAALGDQIAKVAVTPTDADSFAVGLAIMAMLERSWLMVQHNEIPPLSRTTMVATVPELISRMLS